MKKHAVLITVLFALSVTLISVSAVFLEFYKLNKTQYIDQIFTKYSVITQIYRAHHLSNSSDIMLEANLAIYKLLKIKDSKIHKNILDNAKLLKKEGFKNINSSMLLNNKGIYTQSVISDMSITMLEFDKKIYFFLKTDLSAILIQDEELKPYKYGSVLYTYITIISIIILSFVVVLQKLRPLIRLRRKIALFGDGNMNISFKTSSEDEIGSIANELEFTRVKINTLLESRTLFLRNLMHELKTPIAKGTIVTQMLESQKHKDRFISIFGRLESLVTEFALIEEVTSVDDRTDFKEYRLVDIIDGAIDMAMVERDSVTVNVHANVKILVNYRLYTTAIKNMIDNAIKYSPDSHVKILIKNDELSFESSGKCIANPLQYYIEPFTKDNPSKNSFGLGLYLVDSILKAHGKVLAHEYDNGVNRFIFA
ncbi:MAG: ArsS family sensor histidine kinase [Campylobacterota bacterium]|nr:ArsS family sensor histidine kinase [Campylobacterota bacterium]